MRVWMRSVSVIVRTAPLAPLAPLGDPMNLSNDRHRLSGKEWKGEEEEEGFKGVGASQERGMLGSLSH